MTGSRGIREGMVVHSADGERLGKIRKCDADGFYVEKGFFFPEEHFARYSDVREVRGEDVRLSLAKDQLATPPPPPGAMGLRDAAGATAAAASAPRVADDEAWTPPGDQGFVRGQPEYGAAYDAGSGTDYGFERHASADIPAAPYEPEVDSEREYWREARRDDEQPADRGERRDDDEQPRSGVGAPGTGPGSDFVI